MINKDGCTPVEKDLNDGKLKKLSTVPPKKLIQLRLDPNDVRYIDRESKRTGIDRAQLVRSWVKEKSHIWLKKLVHKSQRFRDQRGVKSALDS